MASDPTVRAGERPMWCDDFDMDLPKVIPDARDLLDDMADVTLWTTGHTTHGVLNHPTVWNHDDGMIAFFGLRSPRRPSIYYTSSPIVRCTFWEAVRDAWPHHFIMLVEGCLVIDTAALWPHFETIMWDLRGWREQPRSASRAKAKVRRALMDAAEELRHLLSKDPSHDS